MAGVEHDQRLSILDLIDCAPAESRPRSHSRTTPVEADRGDTDNGSPEEGSRRPKRQRLDEGHAAVTPRHRLSHVSVPLDHSSTESTSGTTLAPTETPPLPSASASATATTTEESRVADGDHLNRHRPPLSNQRTPLVSIPPPASNAHHTRRISGGPHSAPPNGQNGAGPPKPHTALATKKCPICLERTEVSTATICGHLFCHSCIMNSLIFSEVRRFDQRRSAKSPRGTCPVCRRDLTGVDTPSNKRNLVPLQLKLSRRSASKRKGPSSSSSSS